MGSDLQLREAILGYPEPLWSPRTLSCATLSLCLKISHLTPGFHFLIHRAAYKEQGRWLRKAEERSQQRVPAPISALLTSELTVHLLSIMKVSEAALAVLLCTMALCSQVLSAPGESELLQWVSLLSGHSQTTTIFFCGLESL